jgi:hypothetical protein
MIEFLSAMRTGVFLTKKYREHLHVHDITCKTPNLLERRTQTKKRPLPHRSIPPSSVELQLTNASGNKKKRIHFDSDKNNMEKSFKQVTYIPLQKRMPVRRERSRVSFM